MDVAVVPQYPALLDDRLFEWDGDYRAGEPYSMDRIGYHHLRERFESGGHAVTTIDNTSFEAADAVVFVDSTIDYIKQALDADDTPALVYLKREPASIHPFNASGNLARWSSVFDLVLTWERDLPRNSGTFGRYLWPQLLRVQHEGAAPFEERTLLANVSSRKYSPHPEELYSAREDVIEFYDEHHPDEFTLHGRYWNSRPRLVGEVYRAGEFPRKEYGVYRGPIPIDEKVDVYHRHRFALCFENVTGVEGYISEKLFDCFRAGVVPVYWGADDVDDHVPEDAFIDYREYLSPADLHRRLRAIDEEEYRSYVDAARRFLESEAEAFSPETFADTVYQHVESVEHSPPRWIPDDVENALNYRAEADYLINNADRLSRTEYLRRFAGLATNRPSTALRQPGTVYNAARKLLPFLPDVA